MPVYDATNRSEFLQALEESRAQEKVTNAAYIVYHKVAKALSNLFEELGEVPDRKSPEHKQWIAALAAKEKAYKAWQAEAHKHGRMHVQFMAPQRIGDTVREEGPW